MILEALSIKNNVICHLGNQEDVIWKEEDAWWPRAQYAYENLSIKFIRCNGLPESLKWISVVIYWGDDQKESGKLLLFSENNNSPSRCTVVLLPFRPLQVDHIVSPFYRQSFPVWGDNQQTASCTTDKSWLQDHPFRVDCAPWAVGQNKSLLPQVVWEPESLIPASCKDGRGELTPSSCPPPRARGQLWYMTVYLATH